MDRTSDRNYWNPLDSSDFDFSTALKKLNSIFSRPKVGRGMALASWKASKKADRNWFPPTYWCHECDAGAFGKGIATLHGPVCEWCRALVEERCDMRRSLYFADGPKGCEFWSLEMWHEYDDWLEAYYDSITPDCE